MTGPATGRDDVARAKGKRRWYLRLGLVVLVAGIFLFCCVGVPLPMWNAQTRLKASLSRDLGISLPLSARVERAAYVRQRDPSAYYRLQLSPDDLAALIKQLRAGAGATTYSVEDRAKFNPHSMGPTPRWWRPEELDDLMNLQVMPQPAVGASQQFYWWFYSPSRGLLYIGWFDT